MRLGPMSIFLFVLYISIGIFDQTFDANLNAYGNSGENFIFATLLQPWNWGGYTTILGFSVPNMIFVLSSAITVAVGIALTGALFGRSDIATLFGLFTLFIGLGAVPIIAFYSFVTRNVGMFACTVGESCGPANIAGALSAGVLMVMWLFTCMEWWAWRATTQ